MTRECHNCGAPVGESQAYCTQCGVRLGQEVHVVARPALQCPSCGAGISPDQKFCNQCAYPLTKPSLAQLLLGGLLAGLEGFLKVPGRLFEAARPLIAGAVEIGGFVLSAYVGWKLALGWSGFDITSELIGFFVNLTARLMLFTLPIGIAMELAPWIARRINRPFWRPKRPVRRWKR